MTIFDLAFGREVRLSGITGKYRREHPLYEMKELKNEF